MEISQFVRTETEGQQACAGDAKHAERQHQAEHAMAKVLGFIADALSMLRHRFPDIGVKAHLRVDADRKLSDWRRVYRSRLESLPVDQTCGMQRAASVVFDS
jgi:hypothetical protein